MVNLPEPVSLGDTLSSVVSDILSPPLANNNILTKSFLYVNNTEEDTKQLDYLRKTLSPSVERRSPSRTLTPLTKTTSSPRPPDHHPSNVLHLLNQNDPIQVTSSLSSPRTPLSEKAVSSPVHQDIDKSRENYELGKRGVWGLAGLVGIQSDPAAGLPHPIPHPAYHYPPHSGSPYGSAHDNLFLPPPSSLAPAAAPTDAWGAMGHAQNAIGSSLSSMHVAKGVPGSDPQIPYKMDPEQSAAMAAMYYNQTPISSTAPETATAATVSGASGSSDPMAAAFDQMNTLSQYFENPLADEGAGSWLDPNQAHGIGTDQYHPDYALARGLGYPDRKKNIIKQWTEKHQTSSAAAGSANGNASRVGDSASTGESATSRPSAVTAAAAVAGYDFLTGQYHAASHLKPDEAAAAAAAQQLRNDYPYGYPYYGAATAELHPYHAAAAVHMGRESRQSRKREKKNSDLPGSSSNMSRDERRALQLSLPITCSDIINLPMDEFNDLLSKHELTEEQLTLCRDIRRRGKNKVAARNCRKRKIDQIKQLEDEVTRIRIRKTDLIQEHEKLASQRAHWGDMVKRLHDYVLKELGHDPTQWTLQMDHNRQVHILPRSQAEETDPQKMLRPTYHYPQAGNGLMDPHHQQR